MRLFAAIMPPRPVLEEVMRVVRAAAPAPHEEPPRRRFLRRAASGGGSDVPAPARQLDLPDLELMYLPITSFGNVTLGDSVKLAAALRQQAAGWERPRVHLAGGAALEFAGDESVWATMQGDVDALMAVGRGVPEVVKRLGFFVDRRVFRPWLSVGTITDHTTTPYLQSVLDALEAFRGEPWTIEEVSLVERPADATADTFEVMEQMPLLAP